MVFLVPTDYGLPTATIAHEGSPRYSDALTVAASPTNTPTPMALAHTIKPEGEIRPALGT